jgi:Tol biopolymer transport system component
MPKHYRFITYSVAFTLLIYAEASMANFTTMIPIGLTKVDPRLHWKTLDTEHFSIHFPQEKQDLAEKVAKIAERVHVRLAQDIGWIPKERTQVIINDSIDIVNGVSTPLPYNTIIIYPTPPVLGLGHFDEWLENLLIHEYTHILDIDKVGEISKILQKTIGRFWFPKLLTSSLFPEGFATYNETYYTNGGRGRDPYTDMVLREAFLENKMPSIDQLNGFWNGWPSGSASYIYGVALYRFIAEKYGKSSPHSFQRNIADDIWPWNADDAARVSTLHSLQVLWDDWKQESAQKYYRQATIIKERGVTESQQITTSGGIKWNPIWDTTGDAIYYFKATFDAHPAIKRIELQSKKEASVMRVHTLTEHPVFSLSPDGEQLVVSQATFYRSFSVYNDLWIRNLKNGKTRRLSKKLRAKDPAWNPNGDAILCVTNGEGKTQLINFHPTSKDIQLLLPGDDMVFSKPAWSPDGSSFAVSIWKKGGYQDIWLFDAENTSGCPLLHDKAWDISPCWTPDGKYILFTSDRTGVYNLFSLELKTNRLYQVTNVLGGAFAPSVSQNGTQIAFIGYSATGFDIHIMPFDKAKWRLIDNSINDNEKEVDFVFGFDKQKAELSKTVFSNPPTSARNIKTYRPFSTILPRFWLPYPTIDESGLGLAALTFSRDVLSKHTLIAEVEYGIFSRRPGYLFSYVNDQFYPSFSFELWNYPSMIQSQEQDKRQSGESYCWYRPRGGAFKIHIPNITAKRQQWLSFGLERQRIIISEDLPNAPFSGKLSDILIKWAFDNSHRYLKSISPTDGMQFQLGYRRYLSCLGSDETFSEVTSDLRIYLGMPIKHHVLALRGGFIYNSIDLLKFHPERESFNIRGFGNLYTENMIFASAEYRLPLAYIQRGWKTWPIFLQQVHASLFTDYARLSLLQEEYKLSTGVEVCMDAILGNLFQATFRIGIAFPVHPKDNVEGFIQIGDIF